MDQGALLADEPSDNPAAIRNAQLRRAAKDQRQRARRLLVQDNAPLSPKNLRQLREAEAARNTSDQLAQVGRSGDALMELIRSRALAAEVANDRDQRTEAAWVSRTRDETIQLERARGELVEVATGRIEKPGRPVRPRGQIRVKSRDGISTMNLRPRLADCAMRFRELYERADPERSLKSQLAQFQASGRSPTRDPTYCAQTMLIHYGETLKRVEDWIFHAAPPEKGPVWRMLLREVAGKGTPISRLATSGSKRRAYSLELETLLEELAQFLGG